MHVDQHPKVNLTVHIDDVTQEAVEDTPEETVQVVCNSARDLNEAFEMKLLLPLAKQNIALVVSDEATTKFLSDTIPSCSGSAQSGVKNLGIDFQHGKSFGTVSGTRVRRQRAVKFKTRLRRTRRLQCRRDKRAKIYNMGLKSGLFYCIEVTGILPIELKKARKDAAIEKGIWSRGHLVEVGWYAKPDKDPLQLASAGFFQYCKEWWAVTDPALAQAGMLKITELRRGFQSVHDRLLPRPVVGVSVPWALLGHLMWLYRMRWVVVNATHFKKDEGKDLEILSCPPRLCRRLFEESLRRFHLRLAVRQKLASFESSDEVRQMSQFGMWTGLAESFFRLKIYLGSEMVC